MPCSVYEDDMVLVEAEVDVLTIIIPKDPLGNSVLLISETQSGTGLEIPVTEGSRLSLMRANTSHTAL